MEALESCFLPRFGRMGMDTVDWECFSWTKEEIEWPRVE